MKKILLTGGAGFIGSNLVNHIMVNTDWEILNIDKLTYAGNLSSIETFLNNERHDFQQIDICNRNHLKEAIQNFKPDAIMHLAAESHVDRSITGSSAFIETNIIGTYNLLEEALYYYKALDEGSKKKFRFLHVSTDEVYGDLGPTDPQFSETTPYAPSSPYSASKASSDHLVRAWHRTYGFPILVTNCSNNYGPYQFPEKLVPMVILTALRGEPIPVYGKGDNIRDWLFVKDHAKALVKVLEEGTIGETYNIGGRNEMRNIDLVKSICEILDGKRPKNDGCSYADQITFVTDRPGHDMRYAINDEKIRNNLNWNPEEDSSSGFRKTIDWFLENKKWWKKIIKEEYQLNRLG